VGEKCSDKFWLRIRLPRNSRDLLHAANLRHGTDGFTSPPKGGVLRIFFALKNPTSSAGFDKATVQKITSSNTAGRWSISNQRTKTLQ